MDRESYIKRSLEPVIRKAAGEFPVVVLTGPRQSGKTTLLKHIFGSKYDYISLEPPDVRSAASTDPRGFVEMHAPPVIFDEVQYAPDLLSYIKEKVDTARSVPGQYLLTGSQNILLMQRATESLAGRAAMLKLMPLTLREAEGAPGRRLPWERKPGKAAGKPLCYADLWSSLLRGGYPEIVANPGRDYHLWQASYVQTYLERDIRTLRQVGDLTQFQNLLKALAARSAQILNITELARDLGVAVNTVKAWLSVLEATYQVIVLRPYHANIGKRLIKTPKIYFTDTGMLCYLVGLKDPVHAASGPMGGAIMETAVLSEVFKSLIHQGIEPRVYFWRTVAGQEVDIVVEHEGGLIPLEVKLSATPQPAMASSIRSFQDDFGDKARPGFVVHPGDVRLPLGSGATALPFGLL